MEWKENATEGSCTSDRFKMKSHSGKDLGSVAFIDNMMKQSFPENQLPQKS